MPEWPGYEVRVQLVWPGYEVRVQLVSMELLSPYHPQLLLLFPPGEVHFPREGALPLHGTGWGTVTFGLESKFPKSICLYNVDTVSV